MRPAGDYSTRMRIHTHTTAKNGHGQPVPSWTPGPYVWCLVEFSGGRRGQNYGSQQTGADATIYVRGAPALSALDHLVVPVGVTWVIESVYQGDGELVVTASMFDSGVADG